MKYSLKDFRRAAGRHVDDMEMSPEGRARLVKPIKRRRSPLTSIGWAAAMAACLMMVFMLNLPGQNAGTDSSSNPGGPAQIDMPLQTANGASPNETASDAGAAAGTAADGMTSGGAQTDYDYMNATLDERIRLTDRTDARDVYYDYSGRAYYVNETVIYDSYPEYDMANFYTCEEVAATDAGQQYYGDSDANAIRSKFLYTLWPKPECVTYLPEIESGSWQRYYIELGIGTVLKNYFESGDDCWALGGRDGLITDYAYSDLFSFTVDGRAIASLPYTDDDPTMARWGAIDASGAWVTEPVLGQLSELYVDDDELGSITAYYVLSSYLKYEYHPERSTIDSEPGPVYILDMAGNTLFTASEIGGLYGNINSPLPYRDIDSGLYGYLDSSIHVVIAPQFKIAYEFSEGLAAVVLPGDDARYGFIDESGAFAIQPQFWQVQRFGFSGGTVQAMYSYDDVWHDIDTQGNDVTGAVKLEWRRLLNWRDGMPIDGRMGNIGFIFIVCLLIYTMYISRKRGEYEAVKQRRDLGLNLMSAFLMIYAALDAGTHSNLPGFMLANLRRYTGSECTALIIEIVSALIAGFVFGWSMRQRCVRRVSLIAACAFMPVTLGLIRFAFGASTVMDIDVALALLIGEIPGALRRPYDDEYPPRGFRAAALKPIIYVLLAAVIIGLWTYDWGGQAVPVLEDSRVESLNTDENIAYYQDLLENESEDLVWQLGEGWRETLRTALDNPDEYRVLRADFAIKNYSLRPVRSALVWYGTASIPDDSGINVLLDSADVSIDNAIAPFSQAEADFRLITDSKLNVSEGWPEGITPECEVHAIN